MTVYNKEQIEDSVSKRLYYSQNLAIVAFMLGASASVFSAL